MRQGTILGSQIGRWIILAALVAVLGALLLTIRPVVAQTTGCATSGTQENKKVICNYEFVEHGTGQAARLPARELDQTQVVKVWELVRDENDPAYTTGFDDHGDFNIDRKTGVLTFKSSPDYENPMDSDEDNSYKVKAKVGDGEKFLPVEVTVRVTGKEEDGTITLSNRRPEVGETLTATLADPDRGIRTPDWQWQVENGTGGFDDIDEAVYNTYTPLADHEGKKLQATAKYNDSQGIDYPQVVAVSEFAVRAAPGANKDPEFAVEPDGDAAETGDQYGRRIEENTAPRMKVGPAVLATDGDHLAADDANDPGGPRDELTYSLRDPAGDDDDDNTDLNDDDNDPNTPTDRDGHAAMFSINQATGQILTKGYLDYESLDDSQPADAYRYKLVVRATDPSGAFDDMALTIHVLDVDEAPDVTGPAALTYFENADSLLLDRNHAIAGVTADTDDSPYMAADNDLDDDGAGLADEVIQWQLTGPDAAKFQFGASTATYTDSGVVTDATGTPAETPASAESPALQFRSAPNVEAPADKGGRPEDNIYEVTVVAWDGKWEIGKRDVTIRVADTNDLGTMTLSHIQPEVGTAITATVNDPDGISTTVIWKWYRGTTATGTPLRENQGGTTDDYTPVTDDANEELTVTASYTDDKGNPADDDDESTTTTDDDVLEITSATVRAAPLGSNQDPKFYKDGVDTDGDDGITPETMRTPANETRSYVRYVLENKHPRNVALTELIARTNDGDPDNDGEQPYLDGVVNAYDTWDNIDDNTDDPTEDTENLHYALSGADAKYFEIPQTDDSNATPAIVRGLIRTKRALDFETKSVYSVTVTATDPSGKKDTATVTIHVLDQPEIEGLESRIRIDENTKKVTDLSASYPPDRSLGGLKWSLLVPEATDPVSNRHDPRSIDDEDFRFERYNTADTEIMFAIDSPKNLAPDFEKPSDAAESPATAGDNVYKIVVRVAFANLRSEDDANHPNPRDDEKVDQPVWVRVDDVDEVPTFSDDASTQFVTENSDDFLPAIDINKGVTGTVMATDPEDSRTTHPLGDQRTGAKKLTYSLSLPDAYAKMFHIVPATGKILTRSRVDYESLDLEEQGTPGGQYKTITEVVVTATDSSGMEANNDTIDVNLDIRDVNETPIPAEDLSIAGDAAVPDYAEMQEDTTVGTYMVSGDNVATATLSLATGDPDGDGPLTADQNADMALFNLEVNGREGTLKFKAAPDFEMPADADMDNMYMVTLQARHDDEDMAYMPVTITVTDEVELGMLSGAAGDDSFSYAEGGTDVVETYTLTAIEDGPTVTWNVEGADADHFMLEGTDMSRTLNFKSAPDYEMPADADGDNEYMVTVKAEAGGEMAMQAVAVMVTDVDELGMLTADMDSPISYAEGGMDTVATYTVSGGTMADMATWNVEGADADHFMLEGTDMSRTLNFKSAPDYEMPADADGDNEYMVTVKAEAGGEMAMQAVAVMVTDVDELGMLTADMDSPISYAEGGMDTVATYTVSGGTMADMATWNVEGADADHFTITGGMLKFVSAPDYEMPADADGDNEYMVTVKAEAGGEMAMQAVAVMVTDVDELGMLTADMDSPISYAEGGMDTVATYTVSGGTMADMATWNVEGADADHFTITGGMLKFVSAPDYEMPADADGDNEYMVTVKAEAGGEMAMQAVAVMVTDVDELGMLTADMDSPISYAEGGMDTVATYTVSGGTMADMATWNVEGADADHFTITGGMLKFVSAPDYEMPADADGDNEYMVTVKAEAGGEMAMQAVTITVTDVDELGMLSGDDSPSHPENSMDTVATYTASGPMGGTATWNVEGADADYFTITNGMLKFSSAPDYEMPRGMAMSDDNINSYKVTVKASAGGEMEMVHVTVMVTNVDELGMLTADMDSPISYAEGGMDTVATYTVSGGDGTTVNWSLAGADGSHFTLDMVEGSDMSRMLKFKSAPDYEMPRGAAMSDTNTNTYMVTVRATAGTDTDSQEVMVTVTDMDEGGSVTVMPMSAMVGTELTATLDDPDTGVTNTTWQWASAGEDGTYADITDATSATYTVADSDAGMSLMATATYDDVHGEDKMVSSEAVMVSDDVVGRYDTDGEEGISIVELFDAADDYFDGLITITELFDVIEAYYANNG